MLLIELVLVMETDFSVELEVCPGTIAGVVVEPYCSSEMLAGERGVECAGMKEGPVAGTRLVLSMVSN